MYLTDFLQFLLITLGSLLLVHGINRHGYYRAAVLEHIRFGTILNTPQEILKVNLETYKTAIHTAATNGADIIVFPEYGLFPNNQLFRSWVKKFAEDIPDPKKEFCNPCYQSNLYQERPILKELSCLALLNRIYLVVNMADVKHCSKTRGFKTNDTETQDDNTSCPDDGFYLHNTNVVFDRNGTLISRYYKRHLFFEFDMNSPKNPEDIYFETEFGLFTTFVCFDLVYNESVAAVHKHGVINVAYPTHWVDMAPFYFATSFQQSWAMRNKVNLLAANLHQPNVGSLGSGIYSAENGALAYTNDPASGSVLLISNVATYYSKIFDKPINYNVKRFYVNGATAVEAKNEITEMQKMQCTTLFDRNTSSVEKNYKCFQDNQAPITFIKLEGTENTIEKCTDGICCHLSYKATTMDEEYFLGLFSGDFVSLNSFSLGIESCFLTRCDSTDGASCDNYVTESKTVFQHIDLSGNFTASYVYSYAINSDLLLTNKSHWTHESNSKIVYNNSNENDSLLLFALFGRHYEKDKTAH